jgi:hypothetical protein
MAVQSPKTITAFFKNETANLTQMDGFINSEAQSQNTLVVSYSGFDSLYNQSRNFTYSGFYDNYSIHTTTTPATLMHQNTTKETDEYYSVILNGTSVVYVCTNTLPSNSSLVCFTGPAIGIDQDLRADWIWNITDALFGLISPTEMNFTQAGQGTVNGQQCTIVKGNENYTFTSALNGQNVTEKAKTTMCLSNIYYVPLNFSYVIDLGYGPVYANYTETSIHTGATAAEVTTLPGPIHS